MAIITVGGLIGVVTSEKKGLQEAGTNTVVSSLNKKVLKVKYKSPYTISCIELVYYHVGTESLIDILPNLLNKKVKAKYRIKGTTQLKIFIDYEDNCLYFYTDENSQACEIHLRHPIVDSVQILEIEKSLFSSSGLTELIISD